jgi:hypothetical protein
MSMGLLVGSSSVPVLLLGQRPRGTACGPDHMAAAAGAPATAGGSPPATRCIQGLPCPAAQQRHQQLHHSACRAKLPTVAA